MTRILLLLTLTAAVAAPLASAMEAQPVVVVKAAKFGPIAATGKHLALYTWKQEHAGTVRCTGACARMWPPLTVPAHTMVAKHVDGLMGKLGTIKRPDGRTQVTLDGHPLYTYEHDTATQILCDGVDGWFVVRA
jgi:predicted lipoprotein with Yx(FWY)xxD motif